MRVPNEPFRKAVEREVKLGRSYASIARSVGLTRYNPAGADNRCGDTTVLKRRLGLKPISEHRGMKERKFYICKTLDYAFALKLANYLGLDPVDVGL